MQKPSLTGLSLTTFDKTTYEKDTKVPGIFLALVSKQIYFLKQPFDISTDLPKDSSKSGRCFSKFYLHVSSQDSWAFYPETSQRCLFYVFLIRKTGYTVNFWGIRPQRSYLFFPQQIYSLKENICAYECFRMYGNWQSIDICLNSYWIKQLICVRRYLVSELQNWNH